jgi:hypothetical protein
VILYHAIALWVPALGGTFGFARLRTSVVSRRGALKLAPAPAKTAAAADELAA